MQGLGQSYREKEEKEEREEKDKEEKVENEGESEGKEGKGGKGGNEGVKADDRPPVRKTLSGRIIGYTGMDPPTAFNSIIGAGNEGRERSGVDGGEGDEGEGEGVEVLSRVELEMLEYERIKSMRRKKGTLKKNYKPSPFVPLEDVEEETTD